MTFQEIIASIGEWKIFPCKPWPDKAPYIENWQNLATNDPIQIMQWWQQWPDAILGCPTGPTNGFFVVDTDMKPHEGIDGEENLKATGYDVTDTYTVKTRGGGYHRYYLWDDANPVKCTTSVIAKGVDTRGIGGYVIMPPSEGYAKTEDSWPAISPSTLDMFAWIPQIGTALTTTHNFPEGSTEAFLMTQIHKTDPKIFMDTLARVDVNQVETRDEWITVIAAAVNSTGKADWGLDAIIEWSLASEPQYDRRGIEETLESRERDIRKIWNSYSVRDDGAGFGSIKRLADMHNPYVPEPDEEEEDPVIKYEPPEESTLSLKDGMPPQQDGFRGPITWDIPSQLQLFEQYVYVTSTKQIHHRVYQNEIYIADSFNTKFPGKFEKFESGQGKPIKDAWNAYKNLQFQPVRSIEFRPDLPDGVVLEDSRVPKAMPVLNAYIKYDLKSKPGDVTFWTNHIAKMIPDPRDQEIIHSWIATIVQRTGVKFNWAPLIQGAEGNGKSTILRVVSALVGSMYSECATSQMLESDFNGWMEKLLFIGFDEVKLNNKFEIFEKIKSYLSEHKLLVNEKNVKVAAKLIYFNMIFCTNHLDALPMSKNDRRIAPFICAQQTKDDNNRDFPGDYFEVFNKILDLENHGDGIQAIGHFYKNYPVKDEFNPTTGSRNAPHTSSRDAIIAESLTHLARAVKEVVDSCYMGTRGGWLNLTILKTHLKGIKFNDKSLTKALMDLGYECRSRHRLVSGDPTQVRLYSLKGSEAEKSTCPREDYLEENPALIGQINNAMNGQ